MQNVTSVRYTKVLIKGRLHDYQTMLGNPHEIPPNYRRMLEQAPPCLHKFLGGLFGTQATSAEQTLDHESAEYSSENSIRLYHTDPAVLFMGIVICGFGEESAMIASDHQRLANRQRKMLNSAASIRGSALTFFLCGLVLAAVTGTQAYFAFDRSELITLATHFGPAMLVALILLGLGVFQGFRAFLKRAVEKRWTEFSCKRLAAKYPGFRASDPRLVDDEGRTK